MKTFCIKTIFSILLRITQKMISFGLFIVIAVFLMNPLSANESVKILLPDSSLANQALSINTSLALLPSGMNFSAAGESALVIYNLTVQTDGTALATVSPSGLTPVNEGDATPISVTTIPSGYAFVNWTVIGGIRYCVICRCQFIKYNCYTYRVVMPLFRQILLRLTL